MGKLTKEEKVLWNTAIQETVKEIKNWDGLIPDKADREFMARHSHQI